MCGGSSGRPDIRRRKTVQRKTRSGLTGGSLTADCHAWLICQVPHRAGDSNTMDDGTGLPWLTMYLGSRQCEVAAAESPTTLTLEPRVARFT